MGHKSKMRRIHGEQVEIRQVEADREIVSTWEIITPTIAAKMLEKNTLNVPLRQHVVDELVDIIRRGAWQKTHEGIAFDERGNVVDGQHRLWAIVESGLSVWVLVSRGQSRDTRLAIGIGTRRRPHDTLTLMGHYHVTQSHVATAQAMHKGLGVSPRRKLAHDQLLAFVNRHWDAIDFSVTNLRKRSVRGVTTAIVGSVVARAYYRGKEHVTRLQAFCEILGTGLMTSASDEPAITLRNILTQGSGGLGRQTIYAKTERALAAFLARHRLTKLYEATEELFPLPDEQVEAAASAAKRA